MLDAARKRGQGRGEGGEEGRGGRQERKGERGETARETSILHTLCPGLPGRTCFGSIKYYRAKNYQKAFRTRRRWRKPGLCGLKCQ